VQQTVTTDTSGNFRTVSQNSVNLISGNNGWVIDLPGTGERAVQQPFLVDNVLVFVSQIPGAVCSGGCTSFLFGINSLTGGGGMGFLSANGTSYDAIASGAGCLTGLTAVVGSGSSVFIYGFSQNFSGGGTGSSGTGGSSSGGSSSGGSTGSSGGGGGGGTNGKINCPPNVQCNQGNLNNSAHRISWHEMVQ
jgi:Tfp pilus tip-associated adhesin PilY1